MKAKKPLLLAVLILALLTVVLMLPATASGVPQNEDKVVYFHALSADMPDPLVPPLWVTPGGTMHFRDWLYHGLYFVDDPDPAYDDQDPEVLEPLTGWVEDYVSMNQGNVHNKGTVWVGAMSEDEVFGDDPTYTGIWEFSGVCPHNSSTAETTAYYVQGRGVWGEVKGWVLKFEVVIHWPAPPPAPPTDPYATLDGYYIMK